MLFRSKDIDKSEETLRDAVDADPGRTEPYALLASLYVQQSKLDRALQEFQTLSTKQPKSVGVKTMIAAIYQTQNKRSEAQKAYREALALDSSAAVANRLPKVVVCAATLWLRPVSDTCA